jgi:hypothetical protein
LLIKLFKQKSGKRKKGQANKAGENATKLSILFRSVADSRATHTAYSKLFYSSLKVSMSSRGVSASEAKCFYYTPLSLS